LIDNLLVKMPDRKVPNQGFRLKAAHDLAKPGGGSGIQG
jgi:hypothetical protein